MAAGQWRKRQQGNDGRKPGLTVQGIWDCTAALEATQGDWKDKHCDDNKNLLTIVGDDLGRNDVSTFYGNAELYLRSIVVKRKILMIIFIDTLIILMIFDIFDI